MGPAHTTHVPHLKIDTSSALVISWPICKFGLKGMMEASFFICLAGFDPYQALLHHFYVHMSIYSNVLSCHLCRTEGYFVIFTLFAALQTDQYLALPTVLYVRIRT